LSGGQKRRLQLLLVILDEPNVLILDEPTNDLDTDMLAAIEDLLDSFAGTLLVVSHDRYLIERVTDHQYAILDGHFRHLPRGVEQYLELRSKSVAEQTSGQKPIDPQRTPKLRGAELRSAEKEFAAAGRKIEKLQGEVAAVHLRMAEHDQSDYAGLAAMSVELGGLQSQLDEVELRWLELSELLE
jgi:ABC-type multidrug transport system ATPase subunit